MSGQAPGSWRMPDADPQRSRRLGVAGPAHGRQRWSLELGQSLDEPAILGDGTILVPYSVWANRDGLAVVAPDGRLLREIPGETTWRSPMVAADESVCALAKGAIHTMTMDGAARELVRLPAVPARMGGAPGGGFCMHTESTGFLRVDADGRERWRTARAAGDAWREGTWAFGAEGTLFVAEHDTWRSEGDSAEQFSRVAAHGADGRLLWRHVLTSPNPYDNPVNQVRSIWGRDGDAVFFGDPLIQCFGVDGAERWRIDPAREGERRTVGGTPLVLLRDPRLAQAPALLAFTGGFRDWLPCAVDAKGSVYLCKDSTVYALDPELALRWQLRLGDVRVSQPVLAPGGVLLVIAGTALHAIE